MGRARDLLRHQTASTLINVFLLLLFQGAKGLSASETNGKRRPWRASPSHNQTRPTRGESAAGEEKQRGICKRSLAPSQPGRRRPEAGTGMLAACLRSQGCPIPAPPWLRELELLVLQDDVYETAAIIYRRVEKHHSGHLGGRKPLAAASQPSWPSQTPPSIRIFTPETSS